MSVMRQSRNLSDALAHIRQQRFVGRSSELQLFRTALTGGGTPLVGLHLTGPGGIGKTTLLHQLGQIAESLGRPARYLDGRQIAPTPDAFTAALAQGGSPTGAVMLASGTVVLIDTYELLFPLDRWLRDTLLPQLPADTLIVFAGRHTPTAWLSDSAWAAVTRHIVLANLTAAEGAAYLHARGIPDDEHAAVLQVAHGHPLALSLLADVYRPGEAPIARSIGDQRDLLNALLERFLQEVPTFRHRRALELAVITRSTTESLLASVFDRETAAELFSWMRQLSFVEVGPAGLVPHDLVRDTIDADLHWRDPVGYAELRQAVLGFLRRQTALASGLERQRLRFEILFANRRDPGLRQFFVWESADTAYAEPAQPEDLPALVALVERHEGPESATIARHWQRRQPGRFLVYRTPAGDRYGFMLQLALQHVTAEDGAADPAVAAALRFMQAQRPLQAGETASYMRFWMADTSYQGISPALNLTATSCIIHWTTTPDLVWSFVAMAHPDVMTPHFASIRFPRTPEADFVVGGRHYGVFSHNWEADPVDTWRIESQREGLPPVPTAAPADEMLPLAELAAAVRQALRDYTRLDRLAVSPLLRTPVLPTGARTPDALRALLHEAVTSLSGDARDAKLYRALWHTYIEPAASQEQAADQLNLPFNTYRYHLAKGLDRVVAWLALRSGATTA